MRGRGECVVLRARGAMDRVSLLSLALGFCLAALAIAQQTPEYRAWYKSAFKPWAFGDYLEVCFFFSSSTPSRVSLLSKTDAPRAPRSTTASSCSLRFGSQYAYAALTLRFAGAKPASPRISSSSTALRGCGSPSAGSLRSKSSRPRSLAPFPSRGSP